MKRALIAILFALAGIFGFASAGPAAAAPPGPQCVLPCDGPIEKISRICQTAYCVFP